MSHKPGDSKKNLRDIIFSHTSSGCIEAMAQPDALLFALQTFTLPQFSLGTFFLFCLPLILLTVSELCFFGARSERLAASVERSVKAQCSLDAA
jgi:hypothetical protein